jgi:hypothetical protein
MTITQNYKNLYYSRIDLLFKDTKDLKKHLTDLAQKIENTSKLGYLQGTINVIENFKNEHLSHSREAFTNKFNGEISKFLNLLREESPNSNDILEKINDISGLFTLHGSMRIYNFIADLKNESGIALINKSLLSPDLLKTVNDSLDIIRQIEEAGDNKELLSDIQNHFTEDSTIIQTYENVYTIANQFALENSEVKDLLYDAGYTLRALPLYLEIAIHGEPTAQEMDELFLELYA